jgi:hypothetical protein
MLIGFVYTLDNSHKPNYHCSDIQGCIKKVIQIWHVIVYYVHPLISFIPIKIRGRLYKKVIKVNYS